MPLDCTYRIQIAHRVGQLAKVAGALADQEALIGDVVTINVGQDASIREITAEVRDLAHAWEVAGALNALEGVSVLWHHDRAFIHHAGGKLAIASTRPVATIQDMRDVYTPGVARICSAIAENPALASRYTMIGHTVAVCTNGTRVLGLGDIGPRAAMPVMEGKAVFYRQCADISAMPVLIDTKDVDEFVETVVRIAPGFGGIHLEDISAPACFEIESRLIEALDQPVMHDDVHGTAVVALAAALAACDQEDSRLEEQTVGQLGLGAAGFGIAALMQHAGARVVAFDPSEASRDRAQGEGIETLDQDEVLAQAHILVATTGKPGLIAPEQVRDGQIILALTNPYPEIEPAAALAAGAAFAADGATVNNVLGFPGIFRGALLAGAREITVAMKLAAAHAIAALVREAELAPDPLDREVHDRVAQAVREAAQADGVARPEMASKDLGPIA